MHKKREQTAREDCCGGWERVDGGISSQLVLRLVQPVHELRMAGGPVVRGHSATLSASACALASSASWTRCTAWTTNGLLREAGYCTEAGGESQEPGEVPGARLAPWSLWYGLVTRSLTVSIVTLKLRATTISFWWGLCRARSVITDQPVSLQRSSAGDPVRV